MSQQNPTDDDGALFASIDRTATMLAVDQSTVRRLIRAGRLRDAYIGRRHLVFVDSIHQYANEAARTA